MQIDASLFPNLKDFIRARRAPILFRPIMGSMEQFVVGVIAFDREQFHVERANQLEKLNCFYGDQANGAILAIELALNEIESDLVIDPVSFEVVSDPFIAGVKIGQSHAAEGKSLNAIASSWLAAMSSLYTSKPQNQVATTYAMLPVELSDAPTEKTTDRLGGLVLSYVTEKRPELASAFSHDLRSQVTRRRTGVHGVLIDFSGSKLVANFGTLASGSYANSIDRIKRRMWDLKIDRDQEKGVLHQRDHEMLVQHPASNDPQISRRQAERISETLYDLERQADQEEIRFRPMTTIQQIGEHLLEREAA